MKAILLALSLVLISCAVQEKEASDKQKTTNYELPLATLEDAGFRRDSIDSLLFAISTTRFKDFRGLVVIKDNKLVIEEYYNTFWRNSILDIRSAGKSITALLLGVAMEEGLIDDLDQNIYDLFSKNKDLTINEDYKKIKLRQVLDMSSGLDADTDNPETPGHAGKWIAKEDWKEYLLNIPLVTQSGKSWVYADINALLVGMAIEEASGMSLKDYAQEKLFAPLGIHQVYWYTNASNQTGAAGNLYISTLDFAKIGLLLLNEGKWGETQILKTDFIKELLEHQQFDLSNDFPFADSYSMFWYKSSRTFGKKEYDYLFASGNGGNYLVVVPEEEMIIALTSSAYGPGYGHGRSYAIMSKIFEALE